MVPANNLLPYSFKFKFSANYKGIAISESISVEMSSLLDETLDSIGIPIDSYKIFPPTLTVNSLDLVNKFFVAINNWLLYLDPTIWTGKIVILDNNNKLIFSR